MRIEALSFALKAIMLLMSIILTITEEKQIMVMHSPPHPGEVIRELCVEPLGLTVTEAANGLGVSRKTLSALLNGRFGISPEMAIRPYPSPLGHLRGNQQCLFEFQT